ncbi:hypothetical protein SNOG_13247 [Parastagonospora nodorum SN15]|uniref:Uncharacterized protein n=1 Tax=Phaeosphaeria nodorum (strain SN15 / ATCC MYA-4574 / FGSC 10173) TaxID=321614 RepID=Q0U4R7_PHANO|nr:hypothetical protein SNOG_13247 [Parastagonospora nodorum SN15]EAT79574.1 hypothetical protein SNOG_13247 [Parastagonospora nodorum SN15]
MRYSAAIEAVDAVAVGARQSNDKHKFPASVPSRPTAEKMKAYCDLVASKGLTAKGHDQRVDTVRKEEKSCVVLSQSPD